MSLAREIFLKPGDILYREGDINDCGYIIESGEVLLSRNTQGKQINCERRGPGSIIGELSILTNQPRLVTVEAITECRVFRIAAAQIQSRFERLDPILRACIETSISFTASFRDSDSKQNADVPLAVSTLRNADKLMERFRLEHDILLGLERDEFLLMYQPIIRLSDRNVSGFEALMRWDHPSIGRVPPDRFIEVAETAGLISDLTNFALYEATAALQRIRVSSPDAETMFMSVNVSGADIGRDTFVDLLEHILDLRDLNPRLLRLEVTETALIPDPKNAEKNLKRLRSLGCGISIDDFGTGYSNLAYLKSLPLNALKIDRSFVSDSRENIVSQSIIRMLVSLGKELDVDIIAEGVETHEDAEKLLKLGCRFAQGFYFNKPMMESEVMDLVRWQLRGPKLSRN